MKQIWPNVRSCSSLWACGCFCCHLFMFLIIFSLSKWQVEVFSENTRGGQVTFIKSHLGCTKQKRNRWAWTNATVASESCCHHLVNAPETAPPENLLPSHPTLCLQGKKSDILTYPMSSGKKVSYLHLQRQKNHLGKKLLLSCCFLGPLLLTRTFRFLPGRLSTAMATETYPKWIKTQRTLFLLNKSKPHGRMCVRAEDGCVASSNEQLHSSPSAPPLH